VVYGQGMTATHAFGFVSLATDSNADVLAFVTQFQCKSMGQCLTESLHPLGFLHILFCYKVGLKWFNCHFVNDLRKILCQSGRKMLFLFKDE
jgi:hypothetical protein